MESRFHCGGSGVQLLGIGGRCQAALDLLRSFLVGFPPPGFDLGAGVQQCGKPILVEAFVAQAAVETLDGSGKDGVNGCCSGTVNEQFERFVAAWPPELDWDPDMFWVAKPGDGWVPGGFVWKLGDGSYFSP